MRPMFLLLATVLTVPAFAGDFWSPAEDTWSQEQVQSIVKGMKDAPVPGGILAEVEGMAPYQSAQWAWFAEDFNPADYSSVAIAPTRNDLGRYHVTGQDKMQEVLIRRMNAYGPKAWKKSYTLGTDADLVFFTNIRTLKRSPWDFELVVELVGVDKDDQVVLQMQVRGGDAGKAAAIIDTVNGGIFSVVPNDKDQDSQMMDCLRELTSKVQNPITAVNKQRKKGEASFPKGPAVPLHLSRDALVDQETETFGPAIQQQVADLMVVVRDEEAKRDDRRKAARDLGKIGAVAPISELADFVNDKKADKKVKGDLVWSLGEIGHADALPLIKGAKGVSGKTKKYAMAKISEY